MSSWSRLAASLLLVPALVATAPFSLAQGMGAVDAGEAEPGVPAAPVEVDGRVLFAVRESAALPAEQRAATIAERIRQAARDPHIKLTDLRTREADGMIEIRAGEVLVTRVLDADARLEGKSRQELALAYLGIVGKAIEEYRKDRDPDRLRRATVRAATATALFAVCVVVFLMIFRGFDRLLVGRFRRRTSALEAGSREVARTERPRALVRGSARTAQLALIIAALYLYLQYTLGLFPWTRGVAVRLGSWVADPLLTLWRAFVAAIPDLIFLAVLAAVVRYGLKLLRPLFDAVARGTTRFEDGGADRAEPAYNVARVAVVALALVAAYPHIPGSGSDAFKGVALFLGVVLALGSSSVVSDVVAGHAMTHRRAFEVGDTVRIGNLTGDVTAVRLQVTHVRTPKNEEVVVPNSAILRADVTNYSSLARTKGLILHTAVGIRYEVPWRQVEAMLLLAAERTPGLEEDPTPFVLQTGLGDFGVTYELNVFCRNAQAMDLLYSALHRSIQDVFNEHGVQIMTPHYVEDAPRPRVVPKAHWYAPPATPPGKGPEPTDEEETPDSSPREREPGTE